MKSSPSSSTSTAAASASAPAPGPTSTPGASASRPSSTCSSSPPIDYRLAPEHRLPAAIEDGATALSWLKSQAEAGAGADPWLAESVDFSHVFVSGATKDYPVFNPFGPESPSLGPVETGPILMVVAERDFLRDREVDYVMKMRELGKHVELVEFAGRQHGFFELDPYSEQVHELIRVVARFMDHFGHDSA